MDFGSAFSFPFQDEEWIKKFAIGALLVFSVVGIVAVIGWAVEITRRVRRGDESPLPDWSEFGTYIMDGLKMILVAIVWALPIVLLSACLAALSALTEDLARDTGVFITIASSMVSICLGLPWVILVGILLPAAVGHYSDTGSLGNALNPIRAFKIVRSNPGGFLVAWLVGGIAMSVISSVGSLLCVVGFFPAVVYAFAIEGHLTGQAYRQAEATGLSL